MTLSSSHFGFTDFNANIFGYWNPFVSLCVESYKRFICAGLEEKAIQAVGCPPPSSKIAFLLLCNI